MNFNEFKTEVQKELATRLKNVSKSQLSSYLNEPETLAVLRKEYADYSNHGSTTPSSTASCLSMLY